MVFTTTTNTSGENGVKESCQKFGEDNHDVGFIL